MTAQLKIYLVEDNPTIRENLVGTLVELAGALVIGYSETEADANRWLDTHRTHWDLVIVDLFLTQGNGLGVLQQCLARGPHQSLVVLTNYATPEIRRRCAQLGANAVFDKSNEIDGLLNFCIAQSQLLEARESPDQSINLFLRA